MGILFIWEFDNFWKETQFYIDTKVKNTPDRYPPTTLLYLAFLPYTASIIEANTLSAVDSFHIRKLGESYIQDKTQREGKSGMD